MKRKALNALAVLAFVGGIFSQPIVAYAWAFSSGGSCSGCGKYIQSHPEVVDQALAYVATNGEIDMTQELIEAFDLIQRESMDTEMNDMDLALEVLRHSSKK